MPITAQTIEPIIRNKFFIEILLKKFDQTAVTLCQAHLTGTNIISKIINLAILITSDEL